MRSTRVKAEELRNAKQFLAGQFVLSQASLSSVANRISALRLYDLPPDTWQRYVAALQAVTPLTVRAAAEARIGTAPQLIVMVGDLSKMRPEIDIHCPVLVEHDARGDTLAHLIGEDAEMTDKGRLALFESWASTPAGIAPLQRYVSEDNRKASYRARALRELLGGERQGQMLAIGAKARDWPDVAAALSQLLQADLLAKTKTAMSAKVVLLDLVTPAGQGKSPLDASQRDIAATAVAGYAFAGVSPASEPSAVAKAIKARLVKEDLNRLGPPAIEGLEALVACNVWRLASARSLLLIASAAATRALVSGYRRALVENGGLPMQVDLDLLGGFKHAQVVNLLLDAHGRLQSSKKADHPAATARTMATIRSLVSTMADTASREPNEHKGGRTVLERDFSQMQPGFERLLHQRNADDRWWATELLVRHRGMQGLRIAMDELADDDHYSKREFHKRDPKRAVGELCRDEIAPLGNQSVRDVMLAYLHGHHRIAKVIAVTCLKAIGDEGAVDALKTYSDDTDISNSLGLPGPMPVSRLARAAVAVREYIAEVENAFRDGKMSRQVAAAHKESAYFTYALTGRRLRIEVSRQVRRKFGAKLTPSKSKRRKSKRSKSKTSKTSNRAKAAVKDAP